MTPDELRALAKALDKITPVMGLEELHHMETLDRAADFLLACAEEKPVGVYVHRPAELRYGVEWAVGDPMPDGTQLFTHPAPAAPQAEPKPTPASGNDLNVYKEMATNYRNDAQAEPKREPLHELPPLPDYLSPGTVREYARAVERAAYERAAQACEAQISGSDHHYLATHGHWDHMAQAATNCAAAIRALGEQHD